MQQISDLAKEFGGFVVSSNLYQSFTGLGKEVPEASIVIRVPSERLDEALAQIKYYEESAMLSAISVRLIAEEGTQAIEVGPWKPEGAAKDAIQDLIFFLQNFVDFLIRFVLYNLPALILIGIPLYLVFLAGRALFRRSRKPNEKVKQAEEVKKE